MNVKWDAPLKNDQVPNSVLEIDHIDIDPAIHIPTVEECEAVFNPAKQSLKTWGRKPGILLDDPHWIGVCKGTPLHIDPMYPRFTHQLLLRVDDYVLRGLNKQETPVKSGSYVVVDTHSPHQLFAKSKDARWYVGVSMDSDAHLPKTSVIPLLLNYASETEFLTGDITHPNVGGRFVKVG